MGARVLVAELDDLELQRRISRQDPGCLTISLGVGMPVSPKAKFH